MKAFLKTLSDQPLDKSIVSALTKTTLYLDDEIKDRWSSCTLKNKNKNYFWIVSDYFWQFDHITHTCAYQVWPLPILGLYSQKHIIFWKTYVFSIFTDYITPFVRLKLMVLKKTMQQVPQPFMQQIFKKIQVRLMLLKNSTFRLFLDKNWNDLAF